MKNEYDEELEVTPSDDESDKPSEDDKQYLTPDESEEPAGEPDTDDDLDDDTGDDSKDDSEEVDEEDVATLKQELKAAHEREENFKKALAEERDKRRSLATSTPPQPTPTVNTPKETVPQVKTVDTGEQVLAAFERTAIQKLTKQFPILSRKNDPSGDIWSRFQRVYAGACRDNGTVPITVDEILEVGIDAMEIVNRKLKSTIKSSVEKRTAVTKMANTGTNSSNSAKRTVETPLSPSDRRIIAKTGQDPKTYIKYKNFYD